MALEGKGHTYHWLSIALHTHPNKQGASQEPTRNSQDTAASSIEHCTRRSGPFFSRDLFFGKRSVLSNNMYARETLTGTSSERLSPSNFGVQVCWDMSVQMQMHTLWRFAGEPSRMPSVSRALWAACIHSRDGATPPASSTAMASASATREVDIASLFTGTPFQTQYGTQRNLTCSAWAAQCQSRRSAAYTGRS